MRVFTHLQRITANSVTFNPITGLSLMATKAGQSPRFQPKPTTWELVERGGFAHTEIPEGIHYSRK